ncbi:MAG: repeat-containing protein [Alphaproteobacteria bacterium]|nr:repeat-containing protein [Alphaproteobacteria bacterium]
MNETEQRLAMQQATAFHQRGALVEAEHLYAQILAAAPGSFAPRHMLGVLRAQQGHNAEALDLIGTALKIQPRDVGALMNYGNILNLSGRFDEALASYDRALTLQPGDAQVLNNRGSALSNLGRHRDALESFAAAAAARPRYGDALYNQGNTLCVLGRHGEAVAVYEQLLTLEPRHAGALNNLGVALWSLGRVPEALARHDAALAVMPDFVSALNNRANALMRLRRFEEALAGYDRSLAVQPGQPAALESRAGLLLRLKRYREALAGYEAIRAADPKHRYALGGMLTAAMNLCDWKTLAQIRPSVEAAIAQGSAVIPPYMFLALSDDPALQLACGRNAVADQLGASPAPTARKAYAHDKIRVGYISSDFCQHPVPLLLARLIERHDRSRFEILGISTGLDDGSAVRARIVKAFDQFHDIQAQTPQAVAALLQRLEVDILVDLNGHTEGNNFEILSHRACPVQVSYLGYPATTGADFIDYVLTDGVVAPPPDQPFFSEKIVALPDAYFPTSYDEAGAAPTRDEAGLRARGFVFCAFNNSFKITAALFDVWMRLLDQVPGSILWLLAANAGFQDNLRREAAARGVDPARLIFAGRANPQAHMARLGLADLMLDTAPFNGHMTSSDALWRGVPLVTMPGRSFASRVAASLLTAMEMPELVTDSMQAYEALALKLARDPALLQSLRDRMAKSRDTTALFDTDRLRRHVEAAYITMLEKL